MSRFPPCQAVPASVVMGCCAALMKIVQNLLDLLDRYRSEHVAGCLLPPLLLPRITRDLQRLEQFPLPVVAVEAVSSGATGEHRILVGHIRDERVRERVMVSTSRRALQKAFFAST